MKKTLLAAATGGRGVPMATLPQNLVSVPGTVAEDFEDYSAWTLTGTAGGSLADDAVNFKSGSKGLKMTTANSASNVVATKTVNFTCDGNIKLWVYCHDATLPSDGLIILSNEPSAFTNYFQIGLNAGGFRVRYAPGWSLLNIRTADWSTGGGAPSWANPIRQIRIRFNSAAVTHSYTVDSFVIGQTSLPAVVFTLDDGYESVYSGAYAYTKLHRIRMTDYLYSDDVGGAGFMTWAQHLELYNGGWTVANHTSTTANLTGLSLAQQIATIDTCNAAIEAAGITTRHKNLSFPQGGNNADTLTAMASTGMLTGRTILSYNVTGALGELRLLPGRAIGEATTLATAKALVDTIKLRQEVGIWYSHKIIDNPAGASSDWYADRFRAIVDYCIAQGVAMITMDDLYNLQIGAVRIPRAIA